MLVGIADLAIILLYFGVVLTIRGSGLVKMSFPKIEGYRAIPDAQVRLTAGEVLRHRVGLVRE